MCKGLECHTCHTQHIVNTFKLRLGEAAKPRWQVSMKTGHRAQIISGGLHQFPITPPETKGLFCGWVPFQPAAIHTKPDLDCTSMLTCPFG